MTARPLPKFHRLTGAPVVAAVALSFAIGCREDEVDADPARVVEAFVDRMRAVHGDPERGAAALQLVSKDVAENLRERAERASAAAGRPVTPAEMLAPSRFSLEFEPVEYRAEIRGRWSRVLVTGANPQVETAEVHCYLEGEAWRVVLDLPPLPPIQFREE